MRYLQLQLVSACFVSLLVSASPVKADDISPGDKSLLDMVRTMAQDPHLMDPGYLSDKLGVPEVKWEPGPTGRRIWDWCDPASRQPIATLEKSSDPDDGVSNTKLTFVAPDDSRINSKVLQKVFGQPLGMHYDQRLYEASTFNLPGEITVSGQLLNQHYVQGQPEGSTINLSDKTTVTALVPPNCFNVKEFQVEYKGPELAPLTNDEVNASLDERRSRAFDHHQKGEHHKALPLLARHLRVRPTDAEARLKLAESYRARCCINQAIDQYRLALPCAGDDQDLRKRCLDGLQSLKVIPDGTAMVDNHQGKAPKVFAGNRNAVPADSQNISGNRIIRPPAVGKPADKSELESGEQGSSSVASKGGALDAGF